MGHSGTSLNTTSLAFLAAGSQCSHCAPNPSATAATHAPPPVVPHPSYDCFFGIEIVNRPSGPAIAFPSGRRFVKAVQYRRKANTFAPAAGFPSGKSTRPWISLTAAAAVFSEGGAALIG